MEERNFQSIVRSISLERDAFNVPEEDVMLSEVVEMVLEGEQHFQSTTVCLISSEGVAFHVHEEVVMLSEVVKRVLEGERKNEPIPFLNVKSATLTKILEFCRHYRQDPMNEIEKVSEISLFPHFQNFTICFSFSLAYSICQYE